MKLHNIVKNFSRILVLFSLVSLSWGREALNSTVINGVKVDYYLPASLEPDISADGQYTNYYMPPVAVLADPVVAESPLRSSDSDENQVDSFGGNNEVEASSTINVTYVPAGSKDKFGVVCEEFPPEAKAVFDAAIAVWESILDSPVPITIRAGWADLEGSTLGYSGGGSLHHDFSGAPVSSTFYIAALANSLAGSDLDTENEDMHVTYNKNYAWYFGTDGDTPSGKYDFMSVVLHEIGHGLGISGSMDYDAGSGSWGGDGYPYIYDRFMEDNNGKDLLDTYIYPNPSTELGSALTSDSVWFHGQEAMAANGGVRVKIYAPSTWASGSSYTHLDYDTFSGTINRLMVYALSPGSSIHEPGPVLEGMLTDMGWVIAEKNDPQNFLAESSGRYAVNVSWDKNLAGNDVMVAWSSNSVFGVPDGVYNPGDAIAGGGTVLYKGGDTNIVHDGLDLGTKYYYKAWSLLSASEYSLGVMDIVMTESVLFESFENGGVIPSGWSFSYVTGAADWTFINGDGGYGHPNNPHSGSYNAYLYFTNRDDHKTKLITPEINFGSATENAQLTFWHYMEAWDGDQDELRIFYKTSASGAWNLLEKYISDVNTWTKQTVTLPNPNGTYYIAFEGNAKYGYGVCIDDVQITADIPATIDVRITDVWKSGADIVIEWPSSNGWYYLCESTESLSDNPVVWSSVGSGWVLSSGSLMSETDTNAWIYSGRMYRVQSHP